MILSTPNYGNQVGLSEHHGVTVGIVAVIKGIAVAAEVVAAGIAAKCEIQLAYAIGVARPVSVSVDTFGTGKYSDVAIAEAVSKVFDLRPYAIIRDLGLRRPIYKGTASYGHFGRTDIDLPWEKTDRKQALLDALAE